MKFTDKIDTILLSVGSVYSLANIREVLGITILVVNLLWLLSKLCYKIYYTIKHKNPLTDCDKDVQEFVEKLEEFTKERGEK